MITFSRSGKDVLVNIEIGMGTVKEISARIECGSELYAELLRDLIREKFDKATRTIREIEYLRGRRRKKKQDYFWYTLDPSDYKNEE
jgi:hypothetical protein